MHLSPPAGVANIFITDRSLIQLRLEYGLNKCGDDTFTTTGLNPNPFALYLFVTHKA